MKLYGNQFSFNSNKVQFTANYLGLNYEFQSVDLAGGEQRTDAFRKVNPVGRVPALVDGDFQIFESVAICRYLAEKTGSPLYPTDLRGRSVVNQWLDFGSIHVGAAMSKIFYNTIVYKFVGGSVDQKSLEEGRQFLTNFLGTIETQLAKTSFIAGSTLTLADLNILAILDPSEVVGYDLSTFPKLAAWRKKLQAQDFYQKVFPSYTQFLQQATAK